MNVTNIATIEGKYQGEFIELDQIGTGSFDISHENYESIIKECQLLSKVNSDFVVELRDAWIEGQEVYIQTEFCDNNLRDIIDAKQQLFGGSASRNSVGGHELALIDYFISIEIFEELVKSLNYLHTLDTPIIHRDLKPENILLKDSVDDNNKQFLKICDFGYAKTHNYSGQSHTKDKGSISYMAPEVFLSKHYDPKSDIYSLGLIFAEIFDVNAYNFEESIKNKLLREKYELLEGPLLEMLTEPQYDLRPTCAKLLSVINEEGDIIEIKDKVKDEVNIWALYVGEGYVMYYCPKSQELLRDKLETVSKDKDYCVNNLIQFSQSKQLSVQSVDTILATASRVFNRNETFEPKVKTKHNLRIHFVTKCRFGRQFCERLECKEQVAGHEVNIF
ncbi:unnamed protein product [Oppiella nova]|uniref:Protein kinase domain-containing protein n=1 Tax=Oppiella nova TaxID=334625 RepID=A0A7R9QX74_9ACAR|nr:unnamed protein product [Oppiella nova]CAG2178307.1 unnamed protein product [Oppiella nova]